MSTNPVRSRRSQAASRDHILSAAQRLLEEKGVDRLKLTEVAAAAGVSHPTVLHHFGSIAELHMALMERMIRALVDRITEALADAMPESGLHALFDAFGTPSVARLAAWIEITGEAPRLMPVVRDAVRDVVIKRMEPAGWDPRHAEELVVLAATLALGVGLFGRSFVQHLGHAPDMARSLALDLLMQAIIARRPSAAG
jgi:Transcriptional regulator